MARKGSWPMQNEIHWKKSLKGAALILLNAVYKIENWTVLETLKEYTYQAMADLGFHENFLEPNHNSS